MIRPSATVVVLAWKWSEDLVEALTALSHQTTDDFEILVIDNGAGFAAELDSRPELPEHGYLHLSSNLGASAGRNAALTASAGEVLIFLDDDSTPEPGVVAAHLAAYERPGVVAARGRAIPRTDRFLSRAGFNYDLGDEPASAFLNAENNCSIRRAVFEEMGGFDHDLFGHEGNELSLRLVDRYGRDCIQYLPGAVVRHDDYDSVGHYFKKNFRMGAMAARVDLRRIRALRPPAIARRRDPFSFPLRLAGKTCELAGFALARLRGQRRRSGRAH